VHINIKNIVKNNAARFWFYRAGYMYYEVTKRARKSNKHSSSNGSEIAWRVNFPWLLLAFMSQNRSRDNLSHKPSIARSAPYASVNYCILSSIARPLFRERVFAILPQHV
jgi:hypothetical protein